MSSRGAALRTRLPGAAIRTGVAAVRGYGMLTAPARPLPDFLLIGAKRGGTTSFYYSLLEHPEVVPLFPAAGGLLPKRDHTKGVHYFDTAAPGRGERWYRSHFPSVARRAAAGRHTVVGEASPYYLGHPLAAQRAAALVPGAAVIALLRDPVVRTASHHREQVRSGGETRSLEQALAEEARLVPAEEARLRADPRAVSWVHEHRGYARQSEYGDLLAPWLAHYPRTRVLLLLAEEFYADPQRVCATAFAFLGLPNAQVSARVRNAAPALPVEAATRAALADRFAPQAREVARLLGRDPGWGLQ